ncbi:hypothetical protein Fmac_021174 [Flemingia macrophylla]|uniref:Uncharacterized protein n=1 Tax=Flemingia macrophylla TaxID=520843 RepID=A0ABD1LW34_9FABA
MEEGGDYIGSKSYRSHFKLSNNRNQESELLVRPGVSYMSLDTYMSFMYFRTSNRD